MKIEEIKKEIDKLSAGINPFEFTAEELYDELTHINVINEEEFTDQLAALINEGFVTVIYNKAYPEGALRYGK